MSFFASAGRILVTDGASTVFDTDERLFTVTNGPITGSLTLPTRTATRTSTVNNFVDVEANTTLASINPSANTVRGAFSAVVSSGITGAVSNKGWYNASGSYVHALLPRNPALGGTGNAGLPSIAVYTFIASGGVLYLNERVRLESNITLSTGVTTTLILPGVTLTYYLLAGTFV